MALCPPLFLTTSMLWPLTTFMSRLADGWLAPALKSGPRACARVRSRRQDGLGRQGHGKGGRGGRGQDGRGGQGGRGRRGRRGGRRRQGQGKGEGDGAVQLHAGEPRARGAWAGAAPARTPRVQREQAPARRRVRARKRYLATCKPAPPHAGRVSEGRCACVVLPPQARFVSLPADSRWRPVRPAGGALTGIMVMRDSQPGEAAELIAMHGSADAAAGAGAAAGGAGAGGAAAGSGAARAAAGGPPVASPAPVSRGQDDEDEPPPPAPFSYQP
jgi:hypothetical protein